VRKWLKMLESSKINKVNMAQRVATSRSQLNRVLIPATCPSNPANAHTHHAKVSLGTLKNKAAKPTQVQSQSVVFPGNSSNLAAIVGLPRVSFLIVKSSALSLARRKLLADLCSASLVFSRSLMASSMRLTASEVDPKVRTNLMSV